MSVECLFFQFPGLGRVFCAFQGRGLGNISFMTGAPRQEVLDARRKLLERLRPYGLEGWSECKQVHGSNIFADPELTSIDGNGLVEADAQMTCKSGLGLLIKTADCQPLLLAHKSGRFVMALHVGWRANRFNFPALGVKAFCAHYGLAPRDLLAVRGPSLGNAEFVNFSSEWGEEFAPWFDRETSTMNLWALTRHQLAGAGVPEEQIYELDICTHANNDDFYSYRRCKEAGRQGSLIWITD